MSACPYCDMGLLESFGSHLFVSEQGVEIAGPCLAAEPVPEPVRDECFHERVEAFRKRTTGGPAQLAAEILGKARTTWADMSHPEGEDDEPE